MLFNKLKEIVPVLFVVILSACTTTTGGAERINQLDIPSFEKTQIISVGASDIRIINSYKNNIHTGDYAKNFPVLPYDVFENYFKNRFEVTGEGQTLYFVIEKASLFYDRNVNDGGYGANRDDDVYTLDFTVRAISGGDLDNPGREKTVKTVKTLRQRRDVLTRAQRDNGQTDYVARAIAQFDQKFIHSLRENLNITVNEKRIE